MAKRKQHKPAKSKQPTLVQRIETLERLVGTMHLALARTMATARRPNLPPGFLDGRWHLRDGNIYPPENQKPGTPFEPYVRRSPPATE